jgi:hypothetical protein
VDSSHLNGVFQAGDKVVAVVPAYEVMILELSPDSPSFIAPVSEPDSRRKTATRYLDDWTLPDGAPFHFPEHAAIESLKIKTAFFAADEIREALAEAKPSNLASFESLIEKWKSEYPDNFAWSRPDRLWLVIPFTDAETVADVSGRMNGEPLTVQSHTIGRKIIFYADLMDGVEWNASNTLELDIQGLQANQFLGPYLDYPPAAVPWADSKVVFDALLDAEEVCRVPASVDVPKVLSAELVPDHLREGVEARVEATVNMPVDQIGAVRLSGLTGADQSMQFDPVTGKWIYKFTSYPRWMLIMDVAKFEIWVVTKDGRVSNRFSLPLQWRFDNQVIK